MPQYDEMTNLVELDELGLLSEGQRQELRQRRAKVRKGIEESAAWAEEQKREKAANLAKVQADLEAARAEVSARDLKHFEEQAHAAYLKAGGSAADWAAEWHEMRRSHLRTLASEQTAAQKRSFGGFVHGLFS